MKIRYKKTVKKITAIILAFTMLPFSDYGNIAMAGENITNETEEKESPTTAPKGLKDLDITSDLVLDKDMEVNNLTHDRGVIDLNGHVLKINGSYKGQNGIIKINGGSLYCSGNLEISRYQRIIMNNANDYLNVEGSTTIDGSSYYGGDITNGVIEAAGDFTINSNAFRPSGYSKIVLSGSQMQTVNINSHTELNIVELKNYSSEGINSASPINCKTLIRNGSILNVCGEEGSYGYTLEEDIIIDGEYVLISDTLNLNGHTMTVKGDFIQMGGCVDVSKGSLIIEGDYRVQSRRKADDGYSYGMSAGILRMADETDHVIVNGDFITSSSCSGREYLTAGTLELKGDFIVNTEYSRYSFAASNTHKVLLSGKGKQTVNFDICYQGYSAIANLEIENHSEEGVVITGKPCVTGNVNDNGCKVTGSIVPDSAVTFTNNTYHGDLYIYSPVNLEGNYNIQGNVYSQSSVTLSGNLSINGDYTETGSGIVRMNGGSLKIGGNFSASSTYSSSESIDMTGETDYILVNGDFTMKSPCRSYRLTNGTLEVKGDFKADAFYAQGSHRVLLSGDGIQHVSLGDNSYFATLEILNHSEEGVYCEKAVVKSTLIRNGCRLRYGDTEGEFGWTLSEDYIYEGDLVLIDETLDLNGHTLTVKGDFIQQAGEVKINGGALFTEGSYRMQTRKGNKEDYTYTSGAGILNMTNESDLVIVNGSYINCSAADHKDYMTAGVLEVKGDFEVDNAGSNSNRSFYSTGSHKVILNGVGTQKIVWAYQNNYSSRIANLEIAGNGARQINIEGMPYVTGNVNDNNAGITGYIIPGAQTSFAGNSFNGSLRLKETLNVTGELNIAGDVYNDGGRIIMNSGSLIIGGNYDMYNSSYTYGIEMSHPDDYILVNGNFNFNPYYASTLSDGILEVKGNFTASRGFSGCRNHKVILSGSKKQTVNMGSGCTMSVLELNNKSEEGIYAETLIRKDELIRNGCNITYKDAEGEFGWTLSDDEEYVGDLVLVDGTLNLNGHTLTVKGDFIQIGGKADINGGTLIAEGDYRQQNRSGSEGKYTYTQSSAILNMTKPSDTVIIKGDYITNSIADHRGYLTDGLLEVHGNLSVLANSNYNFYPSGSHTLVLNGSKEQTIKIGIYGWNYSGINNLIINNTSDKKVIFENNIYVRGNVKDISGNVEGNISLTDTTCFENKYFSGGIVVSTGVNFSGKAEVAGNINISSALKISGELTVNGDCEMGSSSALVMNGGTFTILGSLSQSGIYSSGISMTHDSDYITVMKDFSYRPYYNGIFSAGTLEVKGDFHAAQFFASGTHKVILGGDGLQTVDIGSNNYFNIVELKNYSNEGVYSETVFRKNRIIRNGCRISYGEGNTVSGYTLSDDYVCEGDFILTDGVMNLNGHTMTVTGDFIESDGELLFNGGKLVIEGDYRLQNRAKDGEEYTYSAGLGKITMNNSEDIMVVNGDFIFEPVSENCSITAGTLEVKGDFAQKGNYGFDGKEGVTLTLSGTDTQTVSSYRLVTFGTIVNNNSSSLIINGEIKAFENLTDNGGNISGSGSVSVDRTDKITENKWSGSVKITGENTLISDMDIGGTLYIDGNMNLNGHTLQAGAVNITKQVEMNGGSISCSGSFTVGIYGRLIMNSSEDYILSGGDFSFVSCYSHQGLLSDGTLEIRGSFMQDSYRNFIATSNHTVILGRKNSSTGRAFIQSVAFNCYAGDTRFNRLILKKAANEYQFHNDINLIANEVVYEIDDTVPPTPVTELTASCMSSTKVSLAFGGAADDSGISGYEIYRNGVKTAVTSKTVYTDTSVKPGLTYEYKVYPFDVYYNRSEESPTASVTMPEDTESPSEPKGLKMVSRTGSSINISWNPSSDNVRTEGYEIYRNGEKAADCKKNSYKDSGLEKDKAYIYSIRAYDAAGNMSEFSKEITFSTVSPDIKEVYPEDNAIIGGSQIKLQVKFADNGNSTGNKVNIEYKNESGNWVQIPPTHIGQSRYNASTFISSYVWDMEGITPGEKCGIKYTLYDADGSSDTKTVTYTIDNVSPELPERFSAKPDNNTIRLKWTPSASADCRSYILLRAEDGKEDYKEIAKLSDRYSDSYTDRNVTAGKQYKYALRAADTFENISGYKYSEEVTADEDKSAPEVKSILPTDNKINGTKMIVAKAEDNVKVEYIRFMIRSAEESQYQELDTIKAVSDQASYSLDTTLYQDGAYYINAVAIDGNGNESIEEYFKKFVIDNTGLSRTESVEVVPSATYATVKWKDVKDTDFGYFQVEMLKDGEFVPVATETKRLFTDVNGLLPETSYTFRVVGYDAIGNRGQESEEVNVVTTADTTSPVIKCVSPISSHYSVLLNLSQMAEDNLGIEKGVFSYSYDGENYSEIGEVYTDEKKKQEEINIDFDISALAEGTIYIKFQAYDTAGNKSEDVVNTYVVDRTAPDVVKNLVEISCNGVAGISWDAPKEDDVDYYIIYRMEKDTGIFRKIEEKCKSIGYYDMNVACGESYRYKICAVDMAGNVSRMSDEVAVTISDDMEAPTVKKIVPSDGSTVGKNQTIKIPVIDNDKIRSVTLEYKGSSKEDIWHTIETDYVNDMIKCCEFTWNTEGLYEGKYSLRAWAEDVSGNISSPYEVTYTLDMTAPKPPEISAETGYFQVQLNISKPVDKDFSHFEIYRKNVGSTNFELIGDTIGAFNDKSYIDKNVKPYDNYEYKVRSYDMYGNYSESNTVIGNADDIDTIKPVAKFSETTMGMTGMEVSFDGSSSTDNSRVTEYTWDFGDGTPKEHGAQVRHVYKEVGTYIVKLTVADAHGNVAYTVGTVVIYDKDAEVGTVEIRFEEEDGCRLPYTIAYFNRGNNDKFTQCADCNGELNMTAEEGVYEMAVYVSGYMPMTTTFTVSRYKENQIMVRLKKGEMIKSEITARKMEIWDILNMGVDLENEANYNKVSYSVTLWFAETPIPVTVECIGAPGGGASKELRVFNSDYTDKPQGNGGYTDYKIKISEHEDERTLICLGVSQTISWLKDMYYVNLSVSNMAEPAFYIKDVRVELELPKELGLASINEGFNEKFKIENGFSFNQEEYTSERLCSGDTLSYDWVVSGTEPGKFKIGARFRGCLMPVDIKLSERLSAECEIEVNSGEDLIMNIMAEDGAYNGELYYIYFTLINKSSSNTFYNLEFSFEDKDALEKTKQTFYLKDNDSALPVVSAQDIIKVGVMKPGTELHGVYTTAMDTENEDTYFRLVKSIASTWEAENMGIKVFVNTIPSHESRAMVEYEDLSMSYYGDPVDVTRGTFTDSKELMALNGFSTLSVDLEYDSGSRYTQSKGEAGYGWSTNYESYVEEHNGIITFHPSPSESAIFISQKAIDENRNPFKDNEEIIYEDETYGEYLCENRDMYDYTLTKNQDGTYIIYAPSKERYYYNESGKLTKIMDSSGRCVSLSYGMNQKIVRDDVSGMRMKLNYNVQGLLTSIEDDNGRHAYILYDENDCITSITDESGYTMSYAYDGHKRIIEEKNNTGDIILTNEYDGEGHICRQVTAAGQDTHYTYKKDEETKLRYVTINTDGAESSVTVDVANHIIEETNANGSTTSYTYDSLGNQTCEKDNYGNTVMKRYDSSGNMIELYDTFANCTKYKYDENGNVTRIESPDGKISTYEYDKRNLMIKSIDPSGKVTTYKYDGNGQLIEETVEGLGSAHYKYQNGKMVSAADYMGNTTLTQYDGMGNVIKKTDPVGAVTGYSYDNSGRIKSVTDALGSTTTYEYDKNGNKESETDAQGNVTKYEYDLAGNNTKIINPDGTEITYEYDKNGNNIKTTYADGSRDIFKYDSVNNITYRKLADGTENKYEYDALNQIINETDADGNQTHYEYYPNGKVYKIQYSDGQSELYTYNSSWQNTAITDQDGNTTSYTYDNYGNVTSTTNPLGHSQKNVYDKFGRMISSTDANGNTTAYKYDAAGKCISVTYPDGSVTGYEYDSAGRTLKEIRYADGTETVTASYTYDLLGRQTSVTDAEGVTQYTEYDYRGNVVSISDSECIKIQENKYDATGNLILTIDGEGRKTEYEYTKTGRVKKASENPGTKEEKTTLYGYDAAGRINKVTDAINGISECIYDTAGRISSVKEPEGGVTKYKYDTRGRITKEINAVGGEKTYTYNTNGTLKQEINGRKQNTLYEYDAAGRVIKRTDNAGTKNEYTVEYTYDNAGNILTTDDGKGVIIRTYDCMNRVTSYTDYKGNTVKYAYDESGNLISLTYPGGEIVRYTYYENGKPQTVTDYRGRKTTYAYDKNGRLSVISRPDGSSETYTYDRQGRVRTQKDKKASGEVIHEYSYTYDTSGNITKIKGADNSTALSKMETAVMEYDAVNRLTKYNSKEVKYDADGNMTYGPLNGRMVHMEYDSRNRLIKAGDTEYEYDAEDVRTAIQTPEYREEYVTDNEGTLSQVLTATRYESCGDGIYSTEGTDTKYIYGNGLISEEYHNLVPVSQEETDSEVSVEPEQDVAENEEIYLLHHYNNTGSTTQVTDIDGNIAAEYVYGTYGEADKVSGDESINSRYLYNGMYGVSTDENGLYYMRTRYYNVGIKRFINADTEKGDISNGQSLNRYCYVQGNPISFTDPFGLSPAFNLESFAHGVLDFLGCFPVIGTIADITQAVMYANEGDTFNMSLCIISAVASGVASVGKLAVKCGKLAKATKYISTGARLIENAAVFTVSAGQAAETARGMWKKYAEDKQPVGAETLGEVATLGLSIFAAGTSAKSFGMNGNKLKSMAVKEKIGGNGGSRVRNRQGRLVAPTEKTLDMALDPEIYANTIAKKYGINLRGSGQDITIKFNSDIQRGTYGRTNGLNPNVIEIGPDALMSENELANTIAHELNHARNFLKGGSAPEPPAYSSGNALSDYISGGR